jgi:hypothetical protein
VATEVRSRILKPELPNSIRVLSTLALVSGLAALTACGKSAPSSGAASAAQTTNYTCTFTELDQFYVGQDPTQSFSSSSGTEIDSIENNTCRNVSNGVASTQAFDSVTRSGGVITLVDPSGTNILNISNNQVTTPQSSLVSCTNGLQATGTLDQVVLDAVDGTISISINWSLIVNGCTGVSSPPGQSAPSPVVIVTPTPMPSSSPTSPASSVIQTSSIIPIAGNFIVDSAANIYSAPSSEPNGAGNGLLKTSADGTTTQYFAGNAVILLAKDSQDNIYVMIDSAGDFPANGDDFPYVTIQKLTSNGTTSVVCNEDACGTSGMSQGALASGGAVDSQGNLYIAGAFSYGTQSWSQIIKISPSGWVVFSGADDNSGIAPCTDGSALAATFSSISSIVVDSTNTIYVNDIGCNSIRKITADGTVSTVQEYSAGSSVSSLAVDGSNNLYGYVNSNSGFEVQSITGTTEFTCGGASSSAPSTGTCSSVFLPQITGHLVFGGSDKLFFLQSPIGNEAEYPLYEIDLP